VSAPRGASTKGQKTDFLIEFRATGDGTFYVERGKTRGSHGKEPHSYRVVDLGDGALDLIETEAVEDDGRDYVAELVEWIEDAEGEFWTANRLKKKPPTGIGADLDRVKLALRDPRFESFSGEQIGERKGSTYYRLAQASSERDDAHDASASPVKTRSVVGVVTPIGDDDASHDPTSPQGDAFDADEIERLAQLAIEMQDGADG
jgi:hypothetical protein